MNNNPVISSSIRKKLTVLLLMFFLLQATWATTNLPVTLQENNISLNVQKQNVESVFQQLNKLTNYHFIYEDSILEQVGSISIHVENSTLDEILEIISRQTNLQFKKIDNTISVNLKENSPAPPSSVITRQNEKRDIQGTVVDETGFPVIGANIVIKGTGTGTVTNLDGEFHLQDVPGNATLQISYIGYLSKEIKIGNQVLFTIELAEDTQKLDEVVIVGYGTQKKVNLTGAITTVKMDDVLGSRPIGNTLQALEGAMPGLQITRNNGKPGTTMNMNVRGVTSINDDNNGQPLVLVDNVPMDIDMLDPNDIESITTLKDAAAAAIYGARAAFGVILITTKQGTKESPMRVTYNNNFSFSRPGTLPKKVDPYTTVSTYLDLGLNSYYGGQDSEKWLGYINDFNNGKYPGGYVYDDGVRYNLQSYDIYKDMMPSAGFQQQHNISVTGGTAKTTYRVSFGMIDEDGILVTDKDSYRRYNASSFVSMDANNWLTIQADLRYSDARTSTAIGGTSEHGTTAVWSFASDLPSMYPTGYGYPTETSNELLPYGTPANLIRLNTPKINQGNNTRLLGRAILKPLKGLEVIGEYSFNRNWSSERSFNEMFQYLNAIVSGEVKDSYTTSKYSMKQQFDTTNAINIYATYSQDIKAHSFSVMGGYNQEAWYKESLESTREDPINQKLPSLSQSTGTITTKDGFSEYALRSLFYRINYAYKGKYLLEMNGRYDGSSRFPKNDRFGFFPSFSAGWRISEEAFMERPRSWLDNLKIRASWGSIGNQNVNYYAYIATMESQTDLRWILPGDDNYIMTIKAPGLVSSSFTWETVNTADIGIDINLFKRLGIVFDWYQRDTKDMLIASQPLPSVLGTEAPKVNAANLRTKGWELSVNWNDRIGKDIIYSIGFSLYDSQTTIEKYKNETGLLIYQKENKDNLYFREGMKFGEIWGYVTDRFYTEDDFENGTLKEGIPSFKGVNRDNLNPGDILYKDFDEDGLITDGDNTIDNPGDMRVIGNSTPRFQYGISAGLTYKDFDLSLFFNGIGKRDLWIDDLWSPNGQFTTSVFDYQLDYWKEDNRHAFYPRIYGEGGNNAANKKRQTKYIRNASYLRLKNVTFGYNLPKDICKKLRIQKLRIFVSGENLYTWHKLPKGYYPDMYSSNVGTTIINAQIAGDSHANGWSYPLMRQYSFGINLTF
ncbi:MAG: TonB-dependent receptor [Tannerellaceae bacterium]|nr:TonB-dependent receptor [Tannerellaceae bacterium]